MKTKRVNTLAFLLIFLMSFAKAQTIKYSHADSIKGSITKARAWWDVLHYNLHVTFNSLDSSVTGYNKITYRILDAYNTMQIDLMAPLVIDSIMQYTKKCDWKRDGDAFYVMLTNVQEINEINDITVYYHGKPHVAKNAPWDGGVVWAKDSNKNSWISIACQGMAGSVWYPIKDHQSDEPDSASIHITTPKELVAVSNGRLYSKKINSDGTTTYNWQVVNPINNYNVIPYIGKYVNYRDTFNGKGGILDLDYWVLEENLQKAKTQFAQVKPMLRCFEDWFGEYPFYEDGYKLVEAPYLGMEHQSAIAYGNNFANGYKGRDLSSSGWGLKWDFIIIHESGHEWFGNSITAADVADNWIHEGFTAYAENLYTEYLFGRKAGEEYVIGTRKEVENDKPIISDYNVNNGGSIDLYYKAANMLNTIRTMVNNDSLWKQFLRDLNKTFYHQIVTSKKIEKYMSKYLNIDLQKIFDQYLRTTKIPVLEYRIRNNDLSYRWTNCVTDFNMTIRVQNDKTIFEVTPSEKWQGITYNKEVLIIDPNYYIRTKKMN